jgi:hypothetical protein
LSFFFQPVATDRRDYREPFTPAGQARRFAAMILEAADELDAAAQQ